MIDSALVENNLTDDILFSELIELEKNLELAFQSGRTPLILDISPDDKICTFYSYQIDAIILEAKALILEGSRQTLVQVMEKARKCLVNAMKYGKLLVIRLGTSSPDFREKFNDDNLRLCDPTVDSNLAYFPKETFYSGGSQLHSEEWAKKLFREEDMKPHKNFAICRCIMFLIITIIFEIIVVISSRSFVIFSNYSCFCITVIMILYLAVSTCVIMPSVIIYLFFICMKLCQGIISRLCCIANSFRKYRRVFIR
jgi:hypothetical protein